MFTYNLGKVLWEVMRNVTTLIQKFTFGKDVIIPAWESIKTFFSKLWKNFTPGIDEFLKKSTTTEVSGRYNGSLE